MTEEQFTETVILGDTEYRIDYTRWRGLGWIWEATRADGALGLTDELAYADSEDCQIAAGRALAAYHWDRGARP